MKKLFDDRFPVYIRSSHYTVCRLADEPPEITVLKILRELVRNS